MPFGYEPAKILGGFDLLLGDVLIGPQGVGVGWAVGQAAGQLGQLANECVVGFVPVHGHFVLRATIVPSPGRVNGGLRLNEASVRATGDVHHEI